ncbi:probable U3 small nucleolar RNA-associated protein 11 [Salvia splendens]|uniref:probable U3 small nucleolar RNA-associated protein 11 n=1 Tax=Salvia splendens TaxID=180675 RepID=UPI001C25158E|nr:probable U3 small nucleolar RNA-associated protein 11 [Salvia splendens]XP_042007078.1 probable U3 small nucleolar RNA-associated protein 11 [Salvia splendens]XP_042007079.1 probable U3 small nucleolar RNA-associated protein 11 [Salvia splendens]XP_042007080.1 probable U3 small nucleolar RNA-associated protein 11 [Salvia splendens]XP_042007081.1 probable U3 small nucleolar RNA-associated protein 11 [Salvia splendens]
MLHSVGNQSSRQHVYYVEDVTEAREIRAEASELRENHPTFEDLAIDIKRKTSGSYHELEARRNRVKELEKIYMDMAMQKELQKKGRNRSFVKMKSFVRCQHLYSNGDRKGNAERGVGERRDNVADADLLKYE